MNNTIGILEKKADSLEAELNDNFKKATPMERSVSNILKLINNQKRDIEKYIEKLKKLHTEENLIHVPDSDEMKTSYNAYTKEALDSMSNEERFDAEIERYNHDFEVVETLKNMLIEALMDNLTPEIPCTTNSETNG